MIKRSGKRRLCAVLAALILLVSICCAGCGQKDVPVQEEDLIRVGFSQVGSESDWRMANTASMISALSEENGFELIFDNAKQIMIGDKEVTLLKIGDKTVYEKAVETPSGEE